MPTPKLVPVCSVQGNTGFYTDKTTFPTSVLILFKTGKVYALHCSLSLPPFEAPNQVKFTPAGGTFAEHMCFCIFLGRPLSCFTFPQLVVQSVVDRKFLNVPLTIRVILQYTIIQNLMDTSVTRNLLNNIDKLIATTCCSFIGYWKYHCNRIHYYFSCQTTCLIFQH